MTEQDWVAELHKMEQKRLAAYPNKVRKVKRLRRQITELNRALRKLKARQEFDVAYINRVNEQFKDAIALVRDANDTSEKWEKVYKSAVATATTWEKLVHSMTWIGGVAGLALGVVITLVLTSLWR